jgi:hypothetical protein
MTGLRRFVAISLVVFAVAVFYILFAGLSANQGGGGNGGGGGANGGQPAVSQTPGQPTQTPGAVISAQEVAKHSSRNDCWIIVSNKVYDVSSYLKSHPGGTGTITPYCGKDATHAFQTKDLGGSGADHSNRAYSHLDSIYVGDLGG